MEPKASSFFTKEQLAKIRAAVEEAEMNTSGEIRVHVETSLAGNVLDRAAWIFKKIGMHATDNQNGVLFYLAVKNREFAVIGDSGINEVVPSDFWENIKNSLQQHFRQGNFTEGLVEGILLAGIQLKDNFPRLKEDVNELSDDVSFDDPDKTAAL